MAKVYEWMTFLTSTQVMGTSVLIEILSLNDWQPRLKSDSPAHQIETIPCQASNQYFKKPSEKPSTVMGSGIFIEAPILSDCRSSLRNNSLKMKTKSHQASKCYFKRIRGINIRLLKAFRNIFNPMTFCAMKET